MALVVQKYGGSSVADADGIKRVAQRIVATRKAGHSVVVVVSGGQRRRTRSGDTARGDSQAASVPGSRSWCARRGHGSGAVGASRVVVVSRSRDHEADRTAAGVAAGLPRRHARFASMPGAHHAGRQLYAVSEAYFSIGNISIRFLKPMGRL